ncbi:MAG TPA: hypothetical protein VIL04_07370 [Solirubrobacterales bacterium]|jgi:hypothetical protein
MPPPGNPLPSLAGTLALLALLAAGLLAGLVWERPSVAPSGPGGEPDAAGLDPDELARLGRERTPVVARRVERLRGLRFEAVPEARLSDTEALRERLEQELAHPDAQRLVALADIELQLLGLLEPDQSLGEIAADTSGATAAYYDPREDELFLLGDAVPAGAGIAEFVLAHELTHALEDQSFGIEDPGVRADDRDLARAALIEGSATELMLRYALTHLGPGELAVDTEAIEPGTDDLPRFVLSEMLFTYFGGQRFVESLLELSPDWKLVDYAYRHRPPASTEQVIHPEKYLANEEPLPAPRLNSPGPGWRMVDRETIGEFATRELLRSALDPVEARRAAAGWGGDRYVLWRRAGAGPDADTHADHALALAWRWDTRRDAREFATAVRDWLAEGLDGRREATDAWRLPQGWAASSARGEVVLVALAPTRAEAKRMTRVR